MIDSKGICWETVIKWMPQDLSDDKSTLVQVMAWCRQAASHYLSQCWPRSMLPYSITRPQWVNSLASERFGWNFRYESVKPILVIDGWGIYCAIALRWVSLDHTDDDNFEFTNGYEMMYKAWSNTEKMPYGFSSSSVKFQGHTGQKYRWFWPELSVSGL